MGWQVVSPSDFGLEVTRTVRVQGQCPMCETTVDVVIGGDDSYHCPCGYFHYNACGDEVITDSHGVSKREWQERLAAKQVTPAV